MKKLALLLALCLTLTCVSGCSNANDYDKLVQDGLIKEYFGVIYQCDSKVSGELVIPEKVDSLSKYAFQHCQELTKVVLPEGLETISEGAFYECTKLRDVVIPDTVVTIEPGAFWFCEQLEKVSVPDSVQHIGNKAFDDCNNITVTYKGKDYTSDNIDQLYALFA